METTYTIDNSDASKDATPATIIVAWVSFCPVPPSFAMVVVPQEKMRSYDALVFGTISSGAACLGRSVRLGHGLSFPVLE
jgi:hypothetical protein